MNLSTDVQRELDAFPPELRALVDAELAAGNSIAEVSHSHPAPPVGCCLKLAKPVTTRPRQSGDGLKFIDRNSSLYSGEFADAKRFYFVVEPPNPPPPEPDMDAIRARHNAPTPPLVNRQPFEHFAGSSLVERFRQSMQINYEKWHDGIGYDLEAIELATDDERAAIEAILTTRGIDDWRDVEALAALGTPLAMTLLKTVMKTGNHEMRGAVMQYAPQLVPDADRIASLVNALDSAVIYGGLTQALDQVAEFHPPPVMDALFRNVLTRTGDAAVHLAAMLMFLHGKAASTFDWDHRPLFLRFHTPPTSADSRSAAREAAFRELCQRMDVDPEPHLDRLYGR